jgi:hypothetical protein
MDEDARVARVTIPVRLRQCPMIPTRFRRAKCWKRCRFYDRELKRCKHELQKGPLPKSRPPKDGEKKE